MLIVFGVVDLLWATVHIDECAACEMGVSYFIPVSEHAMQGNGLSSASLERPTIAFVVGHAATSHQDTPICAAAVNSRSAIIISGYIVQSDVAMSGGIQTILGVVCEGVCARQGYGSGAGVQIRAGAIVPTRHQAVDRDRAVGGDIQSILQSIARIIAIVEEEVGTVKDHSLRCAETMGAQGRAAGGVPARCDIVHSDGAVAVGFKTKHAIAFEIIRAAQGDAAQGAGTPLVIQKSSVHAVLEGGQVAGCDGALGSHPQAIMCIVVEVVGADQGDTRSRRDGARASI